MHLYTFIYIFLNFYIFEIKTYISKTFHERD